MTEMPRLFRPDDLVPVQSLVDNHLAVIGQGGKRRPDLDSAQLWLSPADGLMTRGVHTHSARKAAAVSKSLDTVSVAMANKWFTKEYGVQYVELYAGPGLLLDETTANELPGSPIEALAVRKPFARYVFSDFNQDCVDALNARVGERDNVHVLRGDANDQAHLDTVAGLLDQRALVIVYLDPARPQDLRFSTIRFLSERFKYLDLIINVPVHNLARAILGRNVAGPGAAGTFLNHPSPRDLLHRRASGELCWEPTIAAVRAHYTEQLESLGFLTPARNTVCFPGTNPYYDMLLVSRHPTALKLWNRSNSPEEPTQLSLHLAA